MELGDRKLKILQAIITDFISTADPVGSRTLAKKYNLGISSATIRNEMADLEEMGYLAQPYTSSGRIPSDKGYRLYVDNLMKIKRLDVEQRSKILTNFVNDFVELDNIISKTSKLLSKLTNLTSIVLTPEFKESRLKDIKLLQVDNNNILLIVVSQSGIMRNSLIKTDEFWSQTHLDIVSNILSTKLTGLTIKDIYSEKIEIIKKEIDQLKFNIDNIISVLISILEDMIKVQLYLDGVTNIFSLPEYCDINKARDFMVMLDHKENLTKLLMNRKKNVDITIGKENKNAEMKECSLITATYKVNGRILGKMGVIGPTRMDYSQVVSIVDFITKSLTKALKEY